jgi:DNA adenine methylase
MKTPAPESRTKPILRWPGGKSRLLKTLLPLIPEHVCYVEPFAGGLAVLLAKERSPREVINDINQDIVALYLSVQNHLPEVLRQVDQLVGSRDLFHLFGRNPGMTEIQRAVHFLYRNRISFGGDGHSFGVAKTRGGGGDFTRAKVKELVRAVHERLDGVTIESLPFEKVFENQDSPDTFFFCDPPYLHAKIKAYKGWDEDQLTHFRRHLDKLRGKWLVTLDDSPFNRGLFKDCRLTPVVTQNRCVNNRKHGDQKFGELIIQPA